MKIIYKSRTDRNVFPSRILSFDGKYSFLSIDFPHLFTYANKRHLTAYHAYLTASTSDSRMRSVISSIQNANVLRFVVAKKILVRPEWYDQREFVMREILKEKFSDKDMAAKLVATGDAELVNTLEYDDTFWGVFRKRGRNALGKLLMELRNGMRGKQ